MTRHEFLKQVIERLTRAAHPQLRRACLSLLERQTQTAHLETSLFHPWDVLVMSAALAQCELTITGQTCLRQDPLPSNPLEAALYFLTINKRMQRVTGTAHWTFMMWVSIVPFKHQRPQWGSA